MPGSAFAVGVGKAREQWAVSVVAIKLSTTLVPEKSAKCGARQLREDVCARHRIWLGIARKPIHKS